MTVFCGPKAPMEGRLVSSPSPQEACTKVCTTLDGMTVLPENVVEVLVSHLLTQVCLGPATDCNDWNWSLIAANGSNADHMLKRSWGSPSPAVGKKSGPAENIEDNVILWGPVRSVTAGSRVATWLSFSAVGEADEASSFTSRDLSSVGGG